jgi:hypothetical protein
MGRVLPDFSNHPQQPDTTANSLFESGQTLHPNGGEIING